MNKFSSLLIALAIGCLAFLIAFTSPVLASESFSVVPEASVKVQIVKPDDSTINKSVIARRGCCSHHQGVCSCAQSGDIKCCDGTISPTCDCFKGDIDTTQQAMCNIPNPVVLETLKS